MLNRPLFSALEMAFGKGNIRVAKEDEPMILKRSWSAVVGDDGQRRKDVTVIEAGEEYRLNCPRCGDTRGRLTINHTWGTYRFDRDHLNLWTIQCWNENCFSDFRERVALYDSVFDACEFRRRQAHSLDWSKHNQLRRPRLSSVEPPGPVENLVSLNERTPGHASLRYLRSRFIDPVYIGRVFGVGFCSDSYDHLCASRIFVPVFFEGKRVGYQCRYVGDTPSNKIPPWYTCPAMRTSRVLYNYDTAKNYRTIFVVEGAGDVWGIGSRGCAVFGKKISSDHVKLLAKACDSKTVIVLMLDPELSADARKKVDDGRRVVHHIESAYRKLTEHSKLEGRVVKLYLPGERDPNLFDREYMIDLARFEAAKSGLELDLGKKKAKRGRREHQVA